MLMMNVVVKALQAYRFNQQAIKMQDSAALAVRDFENKARGAEQILTATTDTLEFYAYIAGDVRPAPSKIRFYYESGSLVRGIINPEGAGPVYAYPSANEQFKTVADGLQNNSLFLYYYDADYDYSNDETTRLTFPISLPNIKMVRLSMVIDYNAEKPPVAAEETTLLNLRNLKRNL
jgi:hypothetical protein